MQTILSFVPDNAARSVDNLRGNFFAPMSRKTVHEQRIRVRRSHNGVVHAVVGKGAGTLCLLLLLTHARPDVGDHQIRIARGFLGGVELRDSVASRRHQLAIRTVALRAADAQLEVELAGGVDERVAHVVAIADPGDGRPLDVAPALPERLNVREQLTRVIGIAEAVDNGHRRVGRKALEDVMPESADHDRIGHARQDARRIFHGLAATQLRVARREKDRAAAKLAHARLERDACTGGCLLEHHGQHFPAQRFVAFAGRMQTLEFDRAANQPRERVGVQIEQRQKMLCSHDLGPKTYVPIRGSQRGDYPLSARSLAMSSTSWSSSASLMISGGKRRTTLPAVTLMITPRSSPAPTNSPQGRSSSMPTISPRPRISRTSARSPNACSSAPRRYSPRAAARATRSSSSMASMTASAVRQASGLPPNVVP